MLFHISSCLFVWVVLLWVTKPRGEMPDTMWNYNITWCTKRLFGPRGLHCERNCGHILEHHNQSISQRKCFCSGNICKNLEEPDDSIIDFHVNMFTQSHKIQLISCGVNFLYERNILTRATRLTMLMLKLMFSSSVTRGVGSISGIVNNQDDTYMIGADRNVLITIPDVT